MTETEPAQTVARPWDTAADWSMWEITGQYPTKPGHGGHSFTTCLAVVAARYTHGINRPLFLFIGPLADINEPVDPDWITDARPLLLVDQDNPTQAYWEHDQATLGATDGAGFIAVERRRQVADERWRPQHDDGHRNGELASAAACYALARHPRAARYVAGIWPWHSDWWKPVPGDRVRELVKAGALIAAEIDRLRRLAAPASPVSPAADTEEA